MRTPPTLRALRNPDGRTLRVFCPSCNKDHTHDAIPTHRPAHCWNDHSPFQATGYLLEIPTKDAPPVLVIRRTSAQQRGRV
jgi:hypothetical protein